VDVLTVNNFACTQWCLGRVGQADRQQVTVLPELE
jgi:hypothetical protein